MQHVTPDFLKALAAANGLIIPDERVALVLDEYQSLLRAVADLNALPVTRELEPAGLFTLAAIVADERPR